MTISGPSSHRRSAACPMVVSTCLRVLRVSQVNRYVNIIARSRPSAVTECRRCLS